MTATCVLALLEGIHSTGGPLAILYALGILGALGALCGGLVLGVWKWSARWYGPQIERTRQVILMEESVVAALFASGFTFLIVSSLLTYRSAYYLNHNFMIIGLDSTRADVIGRTIRGHSLTPNIDRFMGRSSVFANTSANPGTRFSFPWILTSQYTGNITMKGSGHALGPTQTVPSLFQKAGFKAVGIFPDLFYTPEMGYTH